MRVDKISTLPESRQIESLRIKKDPITRLVAYTVQYIHYSIVVPKCNFLIFLLQALLIPKSRLTLGSVSQHCLVLPVV